MSKITAAHVEQSKDKPTVDIVRHHLPPKPIPYHALKSVRYASEGFVAGFKREINLRLQVSIGILSGLVLLYYRSYELALASAVLMFITMGFEFTNTAIETLCDLVHPEIHDKVKLIKDMAAAAVWMSSLGWLLILIYGGYSTIRNMGY